MKTRVALAQGHTIQNTDVINGNWSGPNGECLWALDFLGSRSQNAVLINRVAANYAGYGVADPNTTAGTANRYKIKVKVLNDVSSYVVMNAATTKVQVTCYSLLPRADIPAGDDPLSLITAGRSGDLLEPGTTMPFDDPRFTPFMCPRLCMQYKILKPRSFTVHGGGKFTLQLRHSYDLSNYTATTVGNLLGKKAVYRPMLIKIVGELGLVEQAPSNYLRHLAVNCVWKNNLFWQAHASTENRIIYDDEDVTRNLTVAGGGAEEFINQEALHTDTRTNLNMTSVN
jgi:hypothetical protein